MTTNPQFPHTIKITRTTGTYDPFNGGTTTTEEIYNGEGRNYKSGNTNPTNGVLVSDYVVSMPFTLLEILAGDKIEVTDRMTALEDARVLRGDVVDAYLGNLGLNVYWNKTNT